MKVAGCRCFPENCRTVFKIINPYPEPLIFSYSDSNYTMVLKQVC